MDNNKTTPTDAVQSGDQESTISQAKLEQIISARLSRQNEQFKQREAKIREESIKQFLDENGLDETVIERVKTLESTTSETKKLEKALKKSEDEKLKLTQILAQSKKVLEDNIINNEILKHSSTRLRNPQDAVLFLRNKLSVDENGNVVTLDDSGSITDKTVEHLINDLIKEKDYLAAPVSGVGSGSKPSTNATGKTEIATKEARLALLREMFKK